MDSAMGRAERSGGHTKVLEPEVARRTDNMDPVLTPVGLAADCLVMRKGLASIIEESGRFTVVWQGAFGRFWSDWGWPAPSVFLIGSYSGADAVIRHLDSYGSASPPASTVIVAAKPSHTPEPREMERLGIRACLPLECEHDDLMLALQAAQRGWSLHVIGDSGSPRVVASSAGVLPSPREAEVLLLVAEGLRNREIGSQLCLSERTVAFHIRNLFVKADVRSRTQLVALARERGWLG